MADLAATDVTVALDRYKFGKARMSYANLAFGDGAKTYPFGGIPLPAAGSLGINAINDIEIISPDYDGTIWRYDKTNHKLKAYRRAPVVVFEEVVTLTGNTTGYTRYPMAWPLYASSGNQALGLLPAGLTPVANTIAINMYSATPGARALITARAADTFSSITISYITQAWAEIFENLVEAEVMTAGATTTNGITFAEGTPDTISFISVGTGFLCGLMIGLNLNGTVSAPKPLQKGQTAVAGEYALDWTDTSPLATTARPVTTQNWNAATSLIYFNYIKKPASGFLYDRFIEEDSAASISQVYTMAAAAALVKQMLLLSTPGFLPSVTLASTSGTWPIGATGMTLGSTAQWQPTNFYPKAKLTTAGTFTSGTGVAATLTVKPSYLFGVPEDIDNVIPLEIPNGQILKNRTVRALVWGK